MSAAGLSPETLEFLQAPPPPAPPRPHPRGCSIAASTRRRNAVALSTIGLALRAPAKATVKLDDVLRNLSGVFRRHPLADFGREESDDGGEGAKTPRRGKRNDLGTSHVMGRAPRRAAAHSAASVARQTEEFKPRDDPHRTAFDAARTAIIARLDKQRTTEATVRAFAEKFGAVTRCRLVPRPASKRGAEQPAATGDGEAAASNLPSRGYAFVEFADSAARDRVVAEGSGLEVDGKVVLVDVEKGRRTPSAEGVRHLPNRLKMAAMASGEGWVVGGRGGDPPAASAPTPSAHAPAADGNGNWYRKQRRRSEEELLNQLKRHVGSDAYRGLAVYCEAPQGGGGRGRQW